MTIQRKLEIRIPKSETNSKYEECKECKKLEFLKSKSETNSKYEESKFKTKRQGNR